MPSIIQVSLVSLCLFFSASGFADSTVSTSVTKSTTTNNANVTQSTTTTAVTAPNEMDDAIVTAIYAKFAKDSALIGTNLSAQSQSGIVTVSGTVTAQAQADQAVILAKSISGVKDVRSVIQVTTNPAQPKPLPPNY